MPFNHADGCRVQAAKPCMLSNRTGLEATRRMQQRGWWPKPCCTPARHALAERLVHHKSDRSQCGNMRQTTSDNLQLATDLLHTSEHALAERLLVQFDCLQPDFRHIRCVPSTSTLLCSIRSYTFTHSGDCRRDRPLVRRTVRRMRVAPNRSCLRENEQAAMRYMRRSLFTADANSALRVSEHGTRYSLSFYRAIPPSVAQGTPGTVS